jgi:hypothetical protein
MHHPSSRSPSPSRKAWRVAPALLLSLALVAPVAAARPPAAANPAVVTTWNQIALSTIAGPAPTGAGMAGPTAFIYIAFVHLAVYNAVVGITGEYELYRWNARAPKGASAEAAAAVAAHRVLRTYFGTADPIASDLDAKLAVSLALVPDGVPKEQGVRYGLLAANHLIALRATDGRHAAVSVPIATEPGDWSPTPPTFAPFVGAWMGGVDPLAVPSYAQFDPGPPPAISSATYLEEFEEVRDYGSIDSVLRTEDQTRTARFFSDAGLGPMQAGLRDLATRRGLDIDDSARMFAAVETSVADGAGTVWRGKLSYLWWRPITAIRMAETDGNPATAGVPDWTPLITTPPYPDWPSGLCSVVGAVSTALTRLNGDETLDLYLTSAAAGNQTRYFATTDDIVQPAVDARVWSGIHFRTADEVSITIGSQVANWTLDHYFQPTH